MNTAVSPMVVGAQPMRTTCPHCHANITTTVETKPNTKTHLFALILCLMGCWPCCLIPYCMDSCQSQNHYCPECRAYLGTYLDQSLPNRYYVPVAAVPAGTFMSGSHMACAAHPHTQSFFH